MFKTQTIPKNSINATDLVVKGMLKRRSLVSGAILNICDKRAPIRIVK